MAFVSNIDDEEQKNQAQGMVAPGGASNTVKVSPNGGIGSSGGGSTAGAPEGSGGQFATLQTYVNANQGQAAPLADKITSKIGDQYNTLQGQNQQTLSGIQGQVDSGYTKQNQAILDQEAANPVSFASDPNNIQTFQGQLNDSYKGPNSAESTNEYSSQLAKVNNAIAQGQAQTGSDVGRQQLLTQYERKPTAGVTGLNSAILSQDPNSQSKIENAYQPFSNLVSGLTSGAQGINTQIGTAQTEAQTAADKANQQIAGQISGLNTNVNNELAGAQSQYTNYNNAASNVGSMLQNGIIPSSGGVTQYGASQGLLNFIQNNIDPWLSTYFPGQSHNTIGMNFSNAAPTFGTASAPSLNTAASKNDFDMYNALGQIGGNPVNSPLGGLDPALAGSYNVPTIPNVDNKKIAGDMQDALKGVNGTIDSTGYNRYLDLLASLQNYQGLPVTGGPWGSGWSNYPVITD